MTVALGLLCAALLGGCQPDDAAMELARATENLRSGSPSAAKMTFNRLAERNPRDADLMARIAQAYLSTGDMKAARPWMERSVRLKPSVETRSVLSQLRIALGDVGRGCLEQKALLAAAPNDGMTLNNYAYQCQVERGVDLDQAIVALQRAVQLTRGNGAVRDSLGWAYVRRYQQTHQADDLRWGTLQLEQAVPLSVAPQGSGWSLSDNTAPSREVRDHLITAYTFAPQPRILTTGLAGSQALLGCLGAALMKSGPRLGEAAVVRGAELLETAVEASPGDGGLRFYLGEAYLALRQPDRAQVEFDKARALDPALRSIRSAADTSSGPQVTEGTYGTTGKAPRGPGE